MLMVRNELSWRKAIYSLAVAFWKYDVSMVYLLERMWIYMDT